MFLFLPHLVPLLLDLFREARSQCFVVNAFPHPIPDHVCPCCVGGLLQVENMEKEMESMRTQIKNMVQLFGIQDKVCTKHLCVCVCVCMSVCA